MIKRAHEVVGSTKALQSTTASVESFALALTGCVTWVKLHSPLMSQSPHLKMGIITVRM